MIARAIHLVRRFFVSLRGRTPTPADVQWADGFLTPPERRLFDRMTPSDQAHAIDVARRVDGEARHVVAAALLHDVGKVEAEAGVWLRVAATLADPVVPAGIVDRWASARGVRRRLADQLRYPAIGEDLLVAAGADPLVSSWAADHHKPRSQWRIDESTGVVLRAADDDAS